MSEPTYDNPAPTPPRRAGRWRMVLLILVVFISGAAVGAGAITTAEAWRVRDNVRNYEARSRHWSNRLQEQLELTDDQAAEVRHTMIEGMRRLRRQTHPIVRQEMQRMEDQVAQLLPPEKARRWRELLQEKRRRWMSAPPPGGRRDGERPHKHRRHPTPDAPADAPPADL